MNLELHSKPRNCRIAKVVTEHMFTLSKQLPINDLFFHNFQEQGNGRFVLSGSSTRYSEATLSHVQWPILFDH